MHEINKEGFITSKSIYFKTQSKINVSFGKLSSNFRKLIFSIKNSKWL